MTHRPAVLVLLAALSSLPSGQAQARTRPRRGAVAKPSDFLIQAPFPCGTPVHVNCAYGPGCSPAHKRVSSKTSTNDYYAVDFIRPERNNGRGKEVVAVASGVVVFSGWARGGWAPYGQTVYIEHDYEDGEGGRYQTIYAHLRRVLVRPGERVEAGTAIGSLGGSSRHRLDRFGPHLHFAMYRNARRSFGGGQAVVPEPMTGDQDLHPGMNLTACGAPLPVASRDTSVFDAQAVGGLRSR